ncbi:putative vacuolar cation/proton exchanger 2 [Phyllosticta citrichinensis]|uniref:Vacuolar calcium ion transporter n=1 Tax=Phyllosticta citrichinensis TaxID=1130410 RepID=A0ABR1XLZ8_9PEZI
MAEPSPGKDAHQTAEKAGERDHGGTKRPHPKNRTLPLFNHNGHRVTTGIHPDGESGRRGIHPIEFLQICFRSSAPWSKYVNFLWPFVPAAIAIHFAAPSAHLWIFILNFIAMVPAANLIGFGGQELARKLPKVFGVLVETTLGSVVEIVLFMVLITRPASDGFDPIQVIQAAILGSILANLLLCMGMCFFVGGLKREEQTFHKAISETGNGLILVAGMALVMPSAFIASLRNTTEYGNHDFGPESLRISRATAIILLISYVVYIWYQMRSHHGLYDDVLEADELRDADRHHDLAKAKLTLTECIVALAIALTCVSLIAVFLVDEIHYIVHERHVKDAFVGLILVPVVEKAAEHLTAVDEAYDNQMNFALAHVLGACVQTALLNTPLVVFVGWGLGKDMSLDFETFHAVVIILAILVVGNFLRDQKSDYLEGFLCVVVYVIIAICSFYYPNPAEGKSESTVVGEAAAAEAGHRLLRA